MESNRHDSQESPKETENAKNHSVVRGELLTGAIAPTLWKFSLPLMFGFVINMLYSWTDMYFVSRLGTEAVAAIGFAEQINFFIFTLGSGIAVGTGIIVARRIGEGNRKAADEVATQAVASMIIFTSILTVVLLLSIGTILQALGLKDNVLFLAHQYMSAILFGIPGNFLTFQVNAMVRSTGNSMFAMKVLLTTTILNALFAPLLIFGLGPIPALGMLGAGMATALAQIIGALISLYALMSGNAGLKISRKIPTLDFTIIRSIVRLGIPASLQMFSVSISRMAIFTFANIFGTGVTAAYTLGLRTDFLVFMPIFAVGVGLETITGQHLGAGKVERVFQFYRTAVLHLTTLTVSLGILVYLLAEPFARIFTQDENVISHTVTYMHIAVFGYVFFAIGIMSSRVISGAGAAFRSLAIVGGSVVGIQLPLCYILSHFTGLRENGIWLGIALGYAGLAAISYFNVRSRTWLTAKV